LAPPIATITAQRALTMALRLLFFGITLCNLPGATFYSGALPASIVTRDASLIVPVGESLGWARNQTFHFTLLIVWSAKFEKTIFTSETVVLIITFCASYWASLFVTLRIRSVILHFIAYVTLKARLL
jgi:hypothetical protein